MTNNSNSSGPNENPLSGLLKYNEESWKVNNKDSLYGPFASLLNNPYNPFSSYFYTWDKLGQGVKNAWQTGDVWKFFDTTFYQIPGYNNLDKMWGGKNIKWVLDNFAGIDSDGKMSVGNLLINVASIIPIGRVATTGGKLLARYLPKAASAVMNSKIVQTLLKNGTVQTIFKGTEKYLNPLKEWAEPYFKKISSFKIPSITDIGKGIETVSDLINLNPKNWFETASTIGRKTGELGNWLKNTGLGRKVGELGNWVKTGIGHKVGEATKWLKNTGIGRKVGEAGTWLKNKAGRVYDKLIMGKITYKDVKSFVSGGINTLLHGTKGAVDFVKNIFTDMTPKAVKEWVHSSPWRMKNLGLLKKVTGSTIYKTAHNVLSPIIKRNAALRSVYDATRKVHNAYKEIKRVGVRKYVGARIRKYGNRVYRRVKRVYHNYVKPVVHAVASIGRKVYSGVSNAVRGFASWFGFKGPAGPSISPNSSASFISRASGFTYQGYSGSRQSIAETMNCMSGNCVDGTLAQVALARSFGIPAEMIATTWNGTPHVYGRINGVDRDISNHALTGSWSRPPAGPSLSDSDEPRKIELHFHDKVYGMNDFDKQVEKSVNKLVPGGAF